MRAVLRHILPLLLVLLAALPARAQFYTNGEDPGHLRWYSLETPHYELIFPKGADSLARLYGRSLEQFRGPIGNSLGGMVPGEGQRRKMPVVLHTHNPYSNGSVGWAPRRMDLYTHPEAYGSDPIPWHLTLASHEPRHQAQLQFGQKGFPTWFTGEIWAPVYWQLYLEMAYGEGDAVVGETGLALGTRARTADFLNFYRVALDQGDRRSWDRWRYGSFKHYTPNHYALGYVTLGGARSLYSAPLLMRESLDLAWKKPWYIAPYNTHKVISQHAGKPFKQAFGDILDHFQESWKAADEKRGPFLPVERVTRDEDFAQEFSSPQVSARGLVAVRDSYLHPRELVQILPRKKVRHIHYMASETSAVTASGARLFWSETRTHPRWGLDGSSVVCVYDLRTNKFRQLTHGTRFYHPQPSAAGEYLCVVEYPVEGGSSLVVLDSEDGKVLRRVPFPEDVQGTEAVFYGDDFYAFGVTQGGYALYRLSAEGEWSRETPPSIQKLTCLGTGDGVLYWVSDRTGVNELYTYTPATGELLQYTQTRYGGTEFTQDGEYLYFVSQSLNGRPLYRVKESELNPHRVDFADVSSYPIADALTAQERALGPAPDLDAPVPVTAPRRYRKLAHPLRLHSWLPAYVNYDAVKEGSMDLSYETASLGLSGYFQNTLGTFSGMLGYAFHPDPDNSAHWRSALHLKMSYTGLYPVFEATLDVGDQRSRMYVPLELNVQGRKVYSISSVLQDKPEIVGSFRTYVPLAFNHSGVLWGVIPQVSYSFTNDVFALEALPYTMPVRIPSALPTSYRRSGTVEALCGPATQRLGASLRGYVMSRRARSQTYPSWGVGAEVGIGLRPGMAPYYAPNLYGYAYGYLPGFTRAQGLRWTLKGQRKTSSSWLIGDQYVSMAPRGFDAGAEALIGQNFDWQWRITGDYAIPIYVGDISIPAVAYIKNFLLTPHADYTQLPYGYNLWSAGADVAASLARLLVLPFDASVGVSVSYLGGTLYPYTGRSTPWAVSLILGVDF